jgi:hypothetical protein
MNLTYFNITAALPFWNNLISCDLHYLLNNFNNMTITNFENNFIKTRQMYPFNITENLSKEDNDKINIIKDTFDNLNIEILHDSIEQLYNDFSENIYKIISDDLHTRYNINNYTFSDEFNIYFDNLFFHLISEHDDESVNDHEDGIEHFSNEHNNEESIEHHEDESTDEYHEDESSDEHREDESSDEHINDEEVKHEDKSNDENEHDYESVDEHIDEDESNEEEIQYTSNDINFEGKIYEDEFEYTLQEL